MSLHDTEHDLQGTRVSEKKVFSQAYWRDLAKISDLPTMTVEILAYRGQNPNPVWIDSEPSELIDH
jgi:hypothetical protein